jgi:peptide/nickel transport system substrate-binding protein
MLKTTIYKHLHWGGDIMRRFLVILSIWLLCATIFMQQLPPGIPRHETFIAGLREKAINPGYFNVWTLAGVAAHYGIHNLLLEPLWCVEYATGEIINALAAEPPKYNSDFTELTIKLRKGVYWSDGVPFTADDLIYTIELVKNTPGMAYHSQMQQVKEVVKIDNYTVLVKLKESNSRFHVVFLERYAALRPLPKHVFEKVKDPLTFDFNPPVGTGPYVLKGYDPGGYWTLWERREDWDRTPTGILYGMPKLRYVLFIYYGPPEKQVLAMAQHQLDAAWVTFDALKVMIKRIETARPWRKTFPWVVNIDPAVFGLTFNTLKTPFNNPDVRWALTLAIDIVEGAIIASDGAVTLSPIHIPLTTAYYNWYFTKLEDWLKNLEIDLGNGEKFKPYDPEAGFRLAEYAKKRGYPVPDNPELIKRIFGPGWWKYAPDVAAKLLEKNGFYRDKEGKWHLPNGELWKINILAPSPGSPNYESALIAAQSWKKFGIDVVIEATDMMWVYSARGDFDVSTAWPAEPWGGHPDPYRIFEPFYSEYLAPIGKDALWGNHSRWSNPEMDKLIEEIKKTPWGDTRKLVELGVKGLKLLIKEMPILPTFNCPGAIVWDEYYWTNYPTAENMYSQPYHHWPNFKYMLPFLESTGRK